MAFLQKKNNVPIFSTSGEKKTNILRKHFQQICHFTDKVVRGLDLGWIHLWGQNTKKKSHRNHSFQQSVQYFAKQNPAQFCVSLEANLNSVKQDNVFILKKKQHVGKCRRTVEKYS